MPDDLDILIGLWHEMTDQGPEAIEGRFASDGMALLERVLSQEMGASAGDFPSASDFARYVLDLRENERAWSRQLGSVILAAQSWLDSGDTVAAERVFQEFEANCPWKMFVEIARTQRENSLKQ
jgi:hypothetical protein